MTDSELFSAVLRFTEDKGWTFSELAAALGISRAALFNYKRGDKIGKHARSVMLGLLAETERFISVSELKAVPICSLAQAAQLVAQPFGDAGSAVTQEKIALFSNPKDGDFAVVVTGKSMMPWYPPGTKILVGRDEKPRTGDRVIALISEHDEPVFKVFIDLGGEFALLSINQNDGIKELYFDKMDKGSTWFWVFPVKESLRNERSLDSAMKAAGIRHFWQDWVAKREHDRREQQ